MRECPGVIVAVAGQKGGAGKSTVAVNVAAELVHRGRSVLLVDADPQGTSRTWAEVAAEAGRPSPTVAAMGATMHRPDQLPRLRSSFDCVVVDCPPRAGDVQRAALMVADVAVLPCGPSAADAWALAGSLEAVAEARALRPQLVAVVLLTRVQGRTALGRGARDVLAESGLPLLRASLGYRVAYAEALAAGRGVTDYAPADRAAVEVRGLVDELEALLGKARKGAKRRG